MELKKEILSEIYEVVTSVKNEQIKEVLGKITRKKRIFIIGEGRSGLQGKAFAMRLMHLGYTTFVMGETITPSIEEGDILISISGSGNTVNVLTIAQKAKEKGVTVISVTSSKDSGLANISSECLIVPGKTKNGDGIESIQLLSTLFDQSIHIILDYICLLLSKKENISNEEAMQKHSNME